MTTQKTTKQTTETAETTLSKPPNEPLFLVTKLHPDSRLPVRASEGAAGYDVFSYQISETGRANSIVLGPRTTKKVPTGIQILAPLGFAATVFSRSGLAMKSIWVANAPGLIDPDYRGELFILLYNGGNESFILSHETRIAQLVLLPTFTPPISESSIPNDTLRGPSGFGSTGE